jgi:hypothetical protein
MGTAGPASVGLVPRAAEALLELLDQVALEAVVPAQGDLAGQPALARPAGHRVRRHAQQLRNLRPGKEPGTDRHRGCQVKYMAHDAQGTWTFWDEQIDRMIQPAAGLGAGCAALTNVF